MTVRRDEVASNAKQDLGQLRAEEARRRAGRLVDSERRQFLRTQGWTRRTKHGVESWGRGDGTPARTLPIAVVEAWFHRLSADRWEP